AAQSTAIDLQQVLERVQRIGGHVRMVAAGSVADAADPKKRRAPARPPAQAGLAYTRSKVTRRNDSGLSRSVKSKRVAGGRYCCGTAPGPSSGSASSCTRQREPSITCG